MINTWFTADLHLGHEKILHYEKEHRPFHTIQEMHLAIFNNWNKIVRKDDIVYVLGDVAFGRENIGMLGLLHGKKRLVLGNHDTYGVGEYMRWFEKIYGAYYWKDCLLTHIPAHPRSLGDRWMLNVHGHLHAKRVLVDNPSNDKFLEEEDQNYLCVSMEQNNLTPIHADVIIDRVKQLRA